MKNNDTQLIHRTLDGDGSAFAELVEKYQKQVHALVWRKIGDFHIAEEITQDTFLKAYQKLGTLKKSQRFVSWLYVIASNRCNTWLHKKNSRKQLLEDKDITQSDATTYSEYILEENERITVETQRDVVKKLLAKLGESERTVMTLHYFGEMSCSEIGAFLGISANTVKSRLRRAQQRLQKEETMIREALDNFKISPNLTETIMQEISLAKPTAPSGSKPIVPWVVAASTLVVVLFMLGFGNRKYLTRFQKPYSLDATTEMTVDIIDAPIVANIEHKPNVRTQIGSVNTLDKRNNPEQQPNNAAALSAETQVEETVEDNIPVEDYTQWELLRGPLNIIISPNGTRIAVPTSDGISVHDAHTGDTVSRFTAHAPGEMPPSQVLTFSVDASMLASAYGKRIYVSETATGKALAMLEEHPDSITALAFSPDRKILATADGTWTVRLWEISTGKYIRSLTGHPGAVNALAFSPDSKTLASAGGTLRIWDITTGELRHAPDKDLGSINRICFSPDGKLLATGGGWDFTAHLWDVNTGNLLKPLKLHTGEIRDIAFSPDGHTLVTASADKTLTLWDVNTRSLRSRFPAYVDREKMLRTKDRFKKTYDVSAVKFSEDGERLVIASRSGTLHFYDVKIGQYSPTYLDLKK